MTKRKEVDRSEASCRAGIMQRIIVTSSKNCQTFVCCIFAETCCEELIQKSSQFLLG